MARLLPDFGTPNLWLVDRVYELHATYPGTLGQCPLADSYKPLTYDEKEPRERFGCDRLLTEYQSAASFVEEWSKKKNPGM
jgi:hypothetical protein